MIKDLVESDACFVSTITLLGLKQLGFESLDWEPEILRDAFDSVYNCKLGQKSFDKLNCGYSLVGTNAFSATIEGFLADTAVMNNRVFDQSEAPFCTLKMCAWSVWEYMQLLGEMEDGKPTEEFSADIATYIAEVAKLNGISEVPDWLGFARPYLTVPDLSGDVQQFEMYQARQGNYISMLNIYVSERQELLKQQLLQLKDAKVLATPQETAAE